MFFKCLTTTECKNLFKRLAKKLHPDLGGDHDLMILLKEAYEERYSSLEIFEQLRNEKPKDETKSYTFKKKNKPEPAPWDGIYEKVTDDIYRGDPRLSIIDEILNYASKNPTFKTDFTNSVKGFLDKKDYITSSQFNTLIKIYFSFRMDEEDDEEEIVKDKENGNEFKNFS